MNITFLVDHDLPSLFALNLLVPQLGAHRCRIFYTNKTGKADATRPLKDLSAFNSISLINNSSLVSFSDLNAVRLDDVNSSDFQQFVDTTPELVVSIRHMSILRAKVIKVPSHGILNLHSGLLPQYQGVMATFWAMLNKETTIGTSLHFIEDSKIDSGAIIAQSHSPVLYNRSYLWNVISLYRDGCANIVKAIETLAADKALTAKPQLGQARYFSYPSEADIEGAEFPLFNESETLPFEI